MASQPSSNFSHSSSARRPEPTVIESDSDDDNGQVPKILSRVTKAQTTSWTTTTTTTVTKEYLPLPRVTQPLPEQDQVHAPQASRAVVSPLPATTRSSTAEPAQMPHAPRLAPVPLPLSTASPRRSSQQPATAPAASVPPGNYRVARYDANIPRPKDLPRPPAGRPIKKFYLVTAGSEVGIFFTWHKTHSVTSGLSGNVQRGFDTWQEALSEYTQAYKDGTIRLIGGKTATRAVEHPFNARSVEVAAEDDLLFDTIEDTFTDADYDQIPELCQRVANI